MKSQYKLFCTKSAYFCIAFILVLIIYFFISLHFSSTPNNLIWVYESYEKKESLALGIDEPKMITMGGSGGHFGLSGEMMTKELGMPVINYGVHGGLHTYSLKKAKDVLRPGDYVFLPAPYRFYQFNHKKLFDQQPLYVKYILTYDSDTFNQLSLFQKVNYVLVQFVDLVGNVKGRYIVPHQKYTSDTINEYGDETFYGNPGDLSRETPFSLSEDYSSIEEFDNTQVLIDFIEWTKKNNITLIASFPAITRFEEYESLEYQQFFDEILLFYETYGVVVVGEPNDFIYNSSYFYDSSDHLSEEGRELRTKQILPELKQILIEKTAVCLDIKAY